MTDLLVQENQGQVNNDQIINENIHVGCIQILSSSDIDQVFESLTHSEAIVPWVNRQKADGIRLWAKHFTPIGSQGNINIPIEWADFFTLLLLSPSHFDWARSALTSKLWSCMTDGSSSPVGQFQLPDMCPLTNAVACTSSHFSKGKAIMLEEIHLDSEESPISSQLTAYNVVSPNTTAFTTWTERKRPP